VRARDVNPTPADLGGVTSVLYELEHRYKYSFLAFQQPFVCNFSIKSRKYQFKHLDVFEISTFSV
jgi:hypothetical protein